MDRRVAGNESNVLLDAPEFDHMCHGSRANNAQAKDSEAGLYGNLSF